MMGISRGHSGLKWFRDGLPRALCVLHFSCTDAGNCLKNLLDSFSEVLSQQNFQPDAVSRTQPAQSERAVPLMVGQVDMVPDMHSGL